MTSAHQETQAARAVAHSTLEEIERAIMQISWLAQRQFMQLLDEERFRITLPQFYTLIHLQQVGEECKMSDLADATHQSAASLTGVVDRLAEKQLVERTRHERDRRQVMVVVTARGIALISEIRQARRDQMQMALGQLSEQEIDTFMQILDQVLSGMVRVIERGEGGRIA
ncbi:MarR family transcriptional regulator [Oscillochloris sp. ZM17-4]|uniref:MarR family winged helix-turn-helix transcriptional regulator n=1 Tax=Oscillochloris sp. ZM17-4 TaxID=2866714 RepID=UPI001C7349C1|nr:MarR family transcriptional regulator [Oscillochloris sp. ZM17-4]MBX0326536.1 MarR family transcriptional regulator [Oscillochloris sp. ZM17-4]